jgi:hypothetical protein
MAVTPGSAEQRFPGYDVTKQSDTWDGVTASVVLRRLAPMGAPKFFTNEEEPVVRSLLDRLLAQDEAPRVPVFEMIDQRLAEGRGDGYRYEELPEDPETWRRSVAALDAAAKAQLGHGFADVSATQQRDLIERVREHDGQWHGLPAKKVFSLWMRYACSSFYSHPWAWNEIGFGGPAYPRGYKHLALDGREPWEVRERDAHDPIPWVRRAEAAKERHAKGLSSNPSVEEDPATADENAQAQNGRSPSAARRA